MDLQLQGKRALVTGGSRGIGRAIVEVLLAEGATVATCARGAEQLDSRLSDWREQGYTVHGQALDISDTEAMDAWIDASVEQMGGLDIVVSNVSVRLSSTGIERWTDAFEVDFLQHVRIAEKTAPMLEQSSGAFVFIATIASVMANILPVEREYGTMKAALISYASQLAHRLAPAGARSNMVSPGPIDFPGGFWDWVRNENPELFARAAKLPALGRHGTPEEVANAVAFLASPAASYVTGANLRVEGGALKQTNF